ncbi:hypothetical protein PC119_g20090 [Phytophthora cactorum]|uniref:MSP domain-containing protein n=1 Tax=Phytophthora cactorum TaxID=29920 RepID=A0A8T1B6A7_9STRA|nr:hypothetical protein PC115_g18301 [Phytophthora cactorum]KAG2985753.1 hypothetical protein PC119_g20090 [Phytophthora cactorum]
MAMGEDGAVSSSGSSRAPVQQRLHDSFRTDRRYLSQMVVEAQNERSTRVDAVLELKKDLDASAARIGAQSAAIQARDQADRTQQARMHQSLIDQGKNPYEVARHKVVQREARKERSRIDRNIQDREAKLLERIEAEKIIQRRREKIEAENRAYERKYQREMGRAAQEERTNTYLLSRTGKESLDPTGKLVRVYPSQETTIKDNSFGLGRSAVLTPEHRRRVVKKVLSKPTHTGTELSSMLLPRRQQSQRDSEDPGFSADRTEGDNTEPKTSERPSIPSLPGVKPGQDLHKVNHALLSNSDVKLPPIRSRSRLQDPRQEDEENQTTETSRSTKRKPQSRSVLEERQLTKARQRQKDLRFTQTQVVWGRTFTGNAFLANPPMLWFKDFDVNRPFTLGFTLTNVSNTFNQFRLLAMEEEVIELFDIVYEKPGRMSAGMSCSLKMTFTGNEERDLETTLSVAAPTGVFQLPVRCTCKKSVPILAQREVRFPEIVAGERVTVTLTLANEGALPLEYRVRRVLPFPIEPEAVSSTDQAELENDDKSTENDGSVDVEVTNDDPEVQSDANSHENPQEDSGQTVEDANSIEDLQQLPTESRSSRATSATSTKLSVRSKQFETATEEDDVNDSLSPDEQELIDRVLETTLLKPKGAEEPIRFTRRGVVAPYSSSTVSFTFAPAAAMTLHNQPFVVEFPAVSSPDLRRLASIPLLVSGVASQVPVFVSRSQLDFRCCAFGKLYRHQLVVCNRGKVALKVQVQVPKPLAGYVEFNPSFGFVQAAASQDGIFPVQVRFRPEEKMWKRIERAGLGSRELGMLAVPVQVVVPDQVVPVFFLLTARLTSAELQIKTGRSDKGLHFGACCVGHSVSHELTIANAARVPQRIGVTSLPKDVTVADVSEGVGVVLLPGEERTLRVVYMPSFPGVLKGAGTMVGGSSWCHLAGSNADLQCLSDKPVRPTSRLAPRETVRLEIDFEPTEDIFKLAETLYYEAKSSDERDVPVVCAPSVRVELGTGVTTEERHNQQDEELEAKANTKGTSKPRGCHLTWTILCFHQLEGSTDSTQSKTEQLTPFQALEARTTVVQPFLIPSTTSMDFGQVAIGQTLVRDLILETSPGLTESVLLRAQPLHILGAFRLIGALREVPAGSDNKRRRAIRVEFEPRTPLMYEDELELAALGVNIRVKLRGVGINPSLSLTPEDGNLDFQDVLARTRNVRELVLTNGSAFPLAFSIVVVTEKDDTGDDGESITTSTGLPVFTFSPTSAIIPENGSLSVQVVFQPDHQRPDHYSQRFRIKVPNESEQHIICVSGRCWEDQLYAFAPTAEPIQSSDRLPLLTPQPVEDLFDLPPSISLSQLPLSIGVNGLPALGLRRPTSSFVLTFAGDETDTASIGRTTTTLFIGSTLPSIGVYGGLDEVLTGTLANAGGSAGSFELVVDAASPHAKLFTLEPARGSIAAGQQLAVQVTYNPDTTTSSSSARTVVSASAQRRPELEVLQWVQVRVQCVLKGGSLWRTAGGAPAPVMAAGQQPKGANSGSGDGADTRIVMVILRTRLEI